MNSTFKIIVGSCSLNLSWHSLIIFMYYIDTESFFLVHLQLNADKCKKNEKKRETPRNISFCTNGMKNNHNNSFVARLSETLLMIQKVKIFSFKSFFFFF